MFHRISSDMPHDYNFYNNNKKMAISLPVPKDKLDYICTVNMLVMLLTSNFCRNNIRICNEKQALVLRRSRDAISSPRVLIKALKLLHAAIWSKHHERHLQTSSNYFTCLSVQNGYYLDFLFYFIWRTLARPSILILSD